jgi:uncharacterized protein (DUF305 family)
MKTMIMVACLLVTTTLAAQIAPYVTKFMQAMDTGMKVMDRDMAAAPMTGDVDRDFAAMMIPHHQGAIDMAKAELTYGKDPVMRRLAQEILVDQESEINAMLLWLTKNGRRNPIEKAQ